MLRYPKNEPTNNWRMPFDGDCFLKSSTLSELNDASLLCLPSFKTIEILQKYLMKRFMIKESLLINFHWKSESHSIKFQAQFTVKKKKIFAQRD